MSVQEAEHIRAQWSCGACDSVVPSGTTHICRIGTMGGAYKSPPQPAYDRLTVARGAVRQAFDKQGRLVDEHTGKPIRSAVEQETISSPRPRRVAAQNGGRKRKARAVKE